jgi:hypothetical protein
MDNERRPGHGAAAANELPVAAIPGHATQLVAGVGRSGREGACPYRLGVTTAWRSRGGQTSAELFSNRSCDRALVDERKGGGSRRSSRGAGP